MARNKKAETTPLGTFDTAAEADAAIDKLVSSGVVESAGWELHEYASFRDSLNHVHGPTVIIENTKTEEPAVIIYCENVKQCSKLYELLRDVINIKFEW